MPLALARREIVVDLPDELASLEAALLWGDGLDAHIAALDARAQCDLDAECARLMKLASDPATRCQAMSEALGIGEDGEAWFSQWEVWGWVERARRMKCAQPRLGPGTVSEVFRKVRIPNAHFRERFLKLRDANAAIDSDGRTDPNFRSDDLGAGSREEVVTSTLAARLGLFSGVNEAGTNVPDTTALERMLGIARRSPKRGVYGLTIFISYENAVALASVLGMTLQAAGI